MAKASQGVETGDISDARDSEDEEVEIRYTGRKGMQFLHLQLLRFSVSILQIS